MNKEKLKMYSRYAPRVLGILFAVFISLFALDVFSAGYSGMQLLIALLAHLVPVLFVVIPLFIAWRREEFGGALFIIVGFLYIILAFGKFPLYAYFVISGPLFIIGFLFLLSGYLKHSD